MRVFTMIMAILGLMFLTWTTVWLFFVFLWQRQELLEQMMRDHFLAFTGAPMEAISATLVIAVFQTTAGNIEFSGLGFEFRGASGPTVLWIVCFLAIVGGLRLLWG
jgi:hypothetical protein